jgi:drug/metabolite transporter (DMT)-like permease
MNDGGDWRNWVRLATLGVIWGGSFPLVEVALEGFAPMTLAATRLGLAALMLVPLSFFYGGLPKGAAVWAFAFGVALFANALPFSLLSWGQTYVTAGVAGVAMAVMPLMALPLSHLLVPGERMSSQGMLGLGIGFVGVLVLIGFDTLAELGGGSREVMGQLACLAATVCYVLGSITIKRAPKAHPIAFAAAAMLLAALIAIPIAYAVEGVPAAPSVKAGIAIVVLAFGPTVVALMLMLKILTTAGPPFLSLVNYQVPIWATVFGAVFLGEALEPRLAVALVLILFGVAVSQGRIGRRSAPS